MPVVHLMDPARHDRAGGGAARHHPLACAPWRRSTECNVPGTIYRMPSAVAGRMPPAGGRLSLPCDAWPSAVGLACRWRAGSRRPTAADIEAAEIRVAKLREIETPAWCTVILRNAFGVAGAIHQPANRFTIRYAWPSARWGSLPLEGGIEAAYRADIRRGGGPRGEAERDRDPVEIAAQPAADGRGLLGGGDHRPRQTRRLLNSPAMRRSCGSRAWPGAASAPEAIGAGRGPALPVERRSTGHHPEDEFLPWPKNSCCGNPACS